MERHRDRDDSPEALLGQIICGYRFLAVIGQGSAGLWFNLVASRSGARQVIARAQGTEWARWREGVRYGLLGVDVVINPRVLVAQELAKIARSHGALEVIDNGFYPSMHRDLFKFEKPDSGKGKKKKKKKKKK